MSPEDARSALAAAERRIEALEAVARAGAVVVHHLIGDAKGYASLRTVAAFQLFSSALDAAGVAITDEQRAALSALNEKPS